MHPISDTGGTSVPAFLAKLWRMVEDPDTNDLIYWNTDGRSFIIQNQAQFARVLLPLNYKHNNMASFIRQLNMYGFHKITSLDNGGLKFDRDDMEFSHPSFQRGHPFMLENIKRKIAVAAAAAPAPGAIVKPETLNRVLNEVKVMRGKQEVLDDRFSAMKQENEALWREVVMLRQKHMKQQQIVNKLIQFLVTIVQPSGRGNMAMKRRLPLMLNEAPMPSKSRKTGSSDYGLEISSLADSEEEEDDAYMNLMAMDQGSLTESDWVMKMENPIVLKSKLVPASSSRGIISEIPNTPSSTRSHHDDLEDIDEIIEEAAPEADVKQIFEELSEATSTASTGGGNKPAAATLNSRAKKQSPKGKTTNSAVVVEAAPQQQATDGVDRNMDMNQFLKFNANTPAAGSSTNTVYAASSAGGPGVITNPKQEVPPKTWYSNKDGFISAEMPLELFDDHSQGVMGLQDSTVNPTLSEDIGMKLEAAEATDSKKPKKFNGKHLQLARLPSNSGDVFSLATPEDFTMHLDSVQTDLNALKGILSSDGLAYDPSQLTGPGTGASTGGSMSFNPNVLMNLVDNDYMPKVREEFYSIHMFDDQNLMIPYQLSGDCLGGLGSDAGASTSDNANKEAADKQLLAYNPTIDFSELLDNTLDDDSSLVTAPDRKYLITSGVDENGSLNTPQPQ